VLIEAIQQSGTTPEILTLTPDAQKLFHNAHWLHHPSLPQDPNIAFRTSSDSAQLYWQSTLRNAGIPVTDIRDRKYFRFVYFHSPEKVLFKIATDAPGFTVDESVENLGNIPDVTGPV
jgi:hypothetical protein